MAKSTPEEMEQMLHFFQELKNIIEDGEFNQTLYGDYEAELRNAVGDHVIENWNIFLGGAWSRFYWGFQTLLDSVADPNLSYLDWNPEIKKKLQGQGEK